MRTILIFFALILLFIPEIRAEQNQSFERYVHIQLIPEHTDIGPGDSLKLAIIQSIQPGWHTYWKNPGDSGEPLTIKWSLPSGFVQQPIAFPAPHKIQIGPLINFGFENRVVLLQELLVPENLEEGPITLKAEVALLVCKDICIPEFSEYEIILNEGKKENNSALIESAIDALPIKTDWAGLFNVGHDKTTITIDLASEDQVQQLTSAKDFEFFPTEWGIVDYTSPIELRSQGHKIIIEQASGDRKSEHIGSFEGVFIFTDTTNHKASYSVTLTQDKDLHSTKTEPTFKPNPHKKKIDPTTNLTLAIALLFAFIGGIFLNLMPCVFPILSIKALSLCNMREKELFAAKLHGIFYTAGIVTCFTIIAGILIFLKAGGAQIGWGFHLQNPSIVLLLSWLLFLVGLNFSGYFTISTGIFANIGGRYLTKHGLAASFLTGILAVFVATPCTVPFMGAAMGYAFTQPAIVSFAIFLALGLGLAAPYLALSFFPKLQKLLPKPGLWMERFKEFLAFPMYASAAWLVWVNTQQSGQQAIVLALGGAIIFSLSLWLIKNAPKNGSSKNLVIILAFLCLIFPFYIGIKLNNPYINVSTEHVEQQVFTKSTFDRLLAGQNPLFVNMTAAWCITCKLNERMALSTKNAADLFSKHSVDYLKGDWTNYNPYISQYLNSFGRNGVPLYIYYGPRDPTSGERPEPIMLPQLITLPILRSVIKGDSK